MNRDELFKNAWREWLGEFDGIEIANSNNGFFTTSKYEALISRVIFMQESNPTEVLKKAKASKNGVLWIGPTTSMQRKELAGLGFENVTVSPIMHLYRDKISAKDRCSHFERVDRIETWEKAREWTEIWDQTFEINDAKMRLEFARIIPKLKSMPCFALVENNQIKSIGSLFIKETKGYIFNVATSQNQGNGYGKRLMQGMLEHGIELGVNDFFLDSTPQGLPLYHRLGFQIEDFRYSLVHPPQKS